MIVTLALTVTVLLSQLFARVLCTVCDNSCSFADLVAMSPLPYTRPVLRTDGPLVISGEPSTEEGRVVHL